jgi:hypothetical protein
MAHEVAMLLHRMLELAMPETGPLMEDTHPPPYTERVAWAVAELAANNPANQDALRELHGIPPLVWLLDGPVASMTTIGVCLCLLQPPNLC